MAYDEAQFLETAATLGGMFGGQETWQINVLSLSAGLANELNLMVPIGISIVALLYASEPPLNNHVCRIRWAAIWRRHQLNAGSGYLRRNREVSKGGAVFFSPRAHP